MRFSCSHDHRFRHHLQRSRSFIEESRRFTQQATNPLHPSQILFCPSPGHSYRPLTQFSVFPNASCAYTSWSHDQTDTSCQYCGQPSSRRIPREQLPEEVVNQLHGLAEQLALMGSAAAKIQQHFVEERPTAPSQSIVPSGMPPNLWPIPRLCGLILNPITPLQ